MKKLTFLLVLVFIIQATGSSQPCLPEGITFTTQIEIDNFQINYPNCTEIEGDVEINGNDITNLNGLNVLTAFGGSLLIGEYGSNQVLTSLTGLDNVTSIGGDLFIIWNNALISLTGLNNVTFIGGDVDISYNDAMTSLTGLDNVTSIGGDLKICGNDVLTNLTGLENITSIEGNLIIGDYLNSGNPYSGNPSMISLTGLDNVTSIEGSLSIDFNDTLISLTGLDNITSIGRYLNIWNNDALTSLTGLENVTSICEYIYIKDNDALTSFTGLDNVTSVGGWLYIEENDALTNLTGLDNIDAGSISDLYIFDNSSLSTCEVQSVCDYLVSPNGVTYIHYNAMGCNSQAEVEEACESVYVPNINVDSEFSIFPNPARKEIFISIKNVSTINEVNIYNQIGQKVLNKKQITNSIDVSKLRQGMYIIELITNDLRIREKLIIR